MIVWCIQSEFASHRYNAASSTKTTTTTTKLMMTDYESLEAKYELFSFFTSSVHFAFSHRFSLVRPSLQNIINDDESDLTGSNLPSSKLIISFLKLLSLGASASASHTIQREPIRQLYLSSYLPDVPAIGVCFSEKAARNRSQIRNIALNWLSNRQTYWEWFISDRQHRQVRKLRNGGARSICWDIW